MLTGGTSALAENSLPGGSLYEVKISINEPVAGLFAVSKESKARWQERLIERRLGEAQELASKSFLDSAKRSEIENLLNNQINKFTASVNTLALDKSKEVESSELTVRLEAALLAHQRVLQELSQSGAVSSDTVTEISALLAGLKNHELKIKGNREIFDSKLGDGLSKNSEGDSQADVTKEIALGKQGAAENVLASAIKIYNRKKGGFSVSVKSKIDGVFSDAQNNFAEGKAKIISGEYPDAREKFQEVIKLSNEARVSVLTSSIAGEIDEDLGIGSGDQDEDNNVGNIDDDDEEDEGDKIDKENSASTNTMSEEREKEDRKFNDDDLFQSDDDEGEDDD